ncbi:hypothetical protein E3E38_06050 [Thermococcus sp. 18S1]|uniref:hypothetical protein n=1 Tax=Thermococcus sp. 18S1 TaxID=1638210 RepID=UPI001439DCFA|nr:hypothetical protein [Thermococcus sp. 18S1]NJE30609.1 hypothetical protein [Thermococcus sp. 18S1]
MKEKKTFSIPYPILDAFDKNVRNNKTAIIIRAINTASKRRGDFLKFVLENLDNPAVCGRTALLSVYLDSTSLSKLEKLKERIQHKTGYGLSTSRALSFVLLFYLSMYRVPFS